MERLSAIWSNAARRLGLEPDDLQLNSDDLLAQRVLHRLCHALVAGDNALESTRGVSCACDPLDVPAEHSVLRLQAALADRHGLRVLLAVSGEQRAYWDALPDDPLAATAVPADQAVLWRAVAAWLRSQKTPWRIVLHDALSETAALAHAVRASVASDSPWAQTLPAHPTGFALHRNPARRCDDCAWHTKLGPGRPSSRCRQTLGAPGTRAQRIDPAGRACERWEARLDPAGASCAACGACCREGFDLVHVRPRERAARVLHAYLQPTAYGLSLPRPNGRCPALDAARADAGDHHCTAYADRPRACADFAIAGDACLAARRRVGLSR